MLIGRKAERATLEALAEGAARGQGAALLVTGEPGLGKTTLLDDAAERRLGSLTVLRATGRESDVDLPFVALAELLRPAERELDELPGPQAQALAAAVRCSGILDHGSGWQEAFEEALALHDQVPTPFERARTELSFAERLRRVRKRADARARLRSALEVFDTLGAAPWSARALAELFASGETARRRSTPVDALTTQELAVAKLVARGASNREAAAALFVSPKTIEFHLGNVYRKLGVRSRTELVFSFPGG